MTKMIVSSAPMCLCPVTWLEKRATQIVTNLPSQIELGFVMESVWEGNLIVEDRQGHPGRPHVIWLISKPHFHMAMIGSMVTWSVYMVCICSREKGTGLRKGTSASSSASCYNGLPASTRGVSQFKPDLSIKFF